MNQEEFKVGTFWKKGMICNEKCYIIFKIISINRGRGSARIVLLRDEEYGLKNRDVIIPPESDLSVHTYKKLTKEELFLELL